MLGPEKDRGGKAVGFNWGVEADGRHMMGGPGQTRQAAPCDANFLPGPGLVLNIVMIVGVLCGCQSRLSIPNVCPYQGRDTMLTYTHDSDYFHDVLAKPLKPPGLLSVVQGENLVHHSFYRHVGAQAHRVKTMCASSLDNYTPRDGVSEWRPDNGSIHVD